MEHGLEQSGYERMVRSVVEDMKRFEANFQSGRRILEEAGEVDALASLSHVRDRAAIAFQGFQRAVEEYGKALGLPATPPPPTGPVRFFGGELTR